QVLQGLGRGAPPGPRHAGDDDERRLGGLHCLSPFRVDTITSAVAGPMPGTSRICSAVASRSFLTEPKCLSNAWRRAGPRPGTPSSALSLTDLDLLARW